MISMFSKLMKNELRSLKENDPKIKTNLIFSFIPSFIFQIKERPKKEWEEKSLEEENGTRKKRKTK